MLFNASKHAILDGSETCTLNNVSPYVQRTLQNSLMEFTHLIVSVNAQMDTTHIKLQQLDNV